jgi:hypothetical protein
LKKSVVIAVVFALVAALSSFAVVSDPTVASVNVGGSVLPILSVSVSNPVVNIPALSDTGGSIDLGKATFISNYKSWKISFASTNGSKLKHSDSAISDVINYTFTASGLVSAVSLAGIQSVNLGTKTKKDGDEYAMKIDYSANSAASYLTSGVYTDTITITVASN